MPRPVSSTSKRSTAEERSPVAELSCPVSLIAARNVTVPDIAPYLQPFLRCRAVARGEQVIRETPLGQCRSFKPAL